MCQECCKEIDLSKAKKGDRVRSVLNGWGTISNIDSSSMPIWVVFNGQRGSWFYTDGRSKLDHLYPEIVEWLPAKRKVRKEVTVWVNVHEDGNIVAHYSEKSARSYAEANTSPNYRAIAVPCTGHYEVEE